MKNTDISFRGRIGSFQPRLFRIILKKVKSFQNLTKTNNVVMAVIMSVLLLIGNVEINPGPTPTPLASHLEITLGLIQEKKKLVTGNNIVKHATSVWGQLSSIILGNNSTFSREFMKNLFQSAPKENSQKYNNLPISNILQTVMRLKISQPVVANYTKAASSWGIISSDVFGSNTVMDRKFLRDIYTANLEYEKYFTSADTNQSEQRTFPINSPPGPSNFPNKGGRLRRKRKGDAQRQQEVSRSSLPSLSQLRINTQTPQPTSHATPPPDVIQQIISEFNNEVMQFATLPCSLCYKLLYPSLAVNATLNLLGVSNLRKLNQKFILGEKLKVCKRCRDNLKRNSLNPQCVYNGLELDEIPEEISCLTEHEMSLCKQIKCYLKIVLLNKGRGQRALNGMAVHFPQDVEEPVEQLPLNPRHSDVIFVTEKGDRTEFTRQLQIRPDKVHDAFLWLKRNNPLYRNIKINRRTDNDFSPVIISQEEPSTDRAIDEMQTTGNDTIRYIPLQNSASILRASLHQGNGIFGSNSGKQCTAMCMTFFVQSIIESPSTWTRELLDSVLLKGDQFYTEKRRTSRFDFLHPDECVGHYRLIPFAIFQIQITDVQGRIFQGYFNKFPGAQLPRLPTLLAELFNEGHNFLTLVCGDYTVGILKNDDMVFLFDSHSRGPNGGMSENGTACIIKYEDPNDAVNRISQLIHRNFQPKRDFQHESRMAFQLTPITITRNQIDTLSDNEAEVDSSDDEQPESFPSSPQILSPTKKKQKVSADEDFQSCDEESSGDDEEVPVNSQVDTRLPQFIQQFGIPTDIDCVIEADDYVEPDLDDFNPREYTLKRKQRRPLTTATENNLELLAFPQLFPYGVNGFYRESANQRVFKLTILDYFQQRVMSAYKRFAGNTEYLFYSLSEMDRFKAFQKIRVCGNMRQQEGGDGEQLLLNPHIYMSAIRGTQSYWKKYNGDLVAMIKTLGIPTFFLTFSFDDLNSNDVVNALWKAENGGDAETVEAQEIPYPKRKELLNKHAVTAARHFSLRMTKFMSTLQKHSETIFGRKLQDFSYRIEFQARGSPHTHMLLWLQNPPDWTTTEGIQFINQNISCSLQTNLAELVQKYQKHRHTDTCFKSSDGGTRRDPRCRFHFPLPPTDETIVLGDEEIHRNGGKFVQLQRTSTESMINNYHPVLLPLLKCNMDIQPVTSAMAIAYYIAKYISKSEPHHIQEQIQNAMKNITESEIPAQQKMFRIALHIMRRRQVSAQEAAFRLCHLLLRKSSRSTVFLPTFRKENRIRMLRKESLEDGEEQFCSDLIDKYKARPNRLENICLFEFASLFGIQYRRAQTQGEHIVIDDEDVEEFADEENVLQNELEERPAREILNLKNRLGQIYRRTRPAVVKTPNFNPISDRDNYFYSLIVQFCPFREENFCDQLLPEEAFRVHHPNFRKHTDSPCINQELGLEFDQALLRATEFTVEERNDLGVEEPFEMNYAEQDDDPTVSNSEAFPATPTRNLVQDIQHSINMLNPDQRRAFLKVNSVIDLMRRNVDIQNPLKLIVSGEGGSGKSFLISLIAKVLKNTFGKDSVLIAAPTGKAAHSINGLTLHRTFSLPIEFDRIGNLQKLSAKKLADLRAVYKNVSTIIIDEMSMVSYQTLRMIHLRLCEIFNDEQAYGGKHVILFGDLLQIKPVRGSWIFKKPIAFQAEPHLWDMFDFVELRINERQAGGNIFREILRRLRVGAMTKEDCDVLETRVLRPSNPNYQQQLITFQDCIWAFPTVKLAQRYNKRKSEELRKQTNPTVQIYTINAQDTIADPGPNYGKLCSAALIPKTDSKTGGIPKTLDLAVGSRVMLRRNMDIPSGRVNGAIGTVMGFEWNYGRVQPQRGDLPRHVNVKFDHNQLTYQVPCASVDFSGKENTRISRRMIPLILSWGQNHHKLQGITVDKIVVDIGRKIFAQGMCYVALSRVTSLEGLAISDMDYSKLLTTATYSPCNQEALAEYARLRAKFPLPDIQ